MLNKQEGYGLNLRSEGTPPLNRPIISKVHEHKAAFLTGKIQVGDFLIEADGKDLRGIPFDEMMGHLKSIPGPLVDMVLLRKREFTAEQLISFNSNVKGNRNVCALLLRELNEGDIDGKENNRDAGNDRDSEVKSI